MSDAAAAFAGARELNGKVALVTGAARNIGRAIALSLAKGGADVLVAAHRSVPEAQETRDLARAAGSRAEVALGDLAEPDGARRVVDRCVAAFGRLDIVVCNAALRSDHPLETISPDEWRLYIDSMKVIHKEGIELNRCGGKGVG